MLQIFPEPLEHLLRVHPSARLHAVHLLLSRDPYLLQVGQLQRRDGRQGAQSSHRLVTHAVLRC